MRRQHYFSLAFADDGGRTLSVTMKGQHKRVTAVMIREALQVLEMSENSALLSACWLGKMTEDEYTKGVSQRRGVGYWLCLAAILSPLIAIPGTYWIAEVF